MLTKLMCYLNRKKTTVTFNDPARVTPVSRVFGLDRGIPINRYYIDKFLTGQAGLIRGHVLEIGDSTYSQRFDGGQIGKSDVLHAIPGNPMASIIGNLTDHASLPENTFDCFICTQTFDCIFEVQKAVNGAHHLLKPGGVLLATMSGISQISRYDMDRWGEYWRFTTASATRLFESVFTGGADVDSYGNVLAATAFLQGLALEDLPDSTLLDARDEDYQLLITVVARKG